MRRERVISFRILYGLSSLQERIFTSRTYTLISRTNSPPPFENAFSLREQILSCRERALLSWRTDCHFEKEYSHSENGLFSLRARILSSRERTPPFENDLWDIHIATPSICISASDTLRKRFTQGPLPIKTTAAPTPSSAIDECTHGCSISTTPGGERCCGDNNVICSAGTISNESFQAGPLHISDMKSVLLFPCLCLDLLVTAIDVILLKHMMARACNVTR